MRARPALHSLIVIMTVSAFGGCRTSERQTMNETMNEAVTDNATANIAVPPKSNDKWPGKSEIDWGKFRPLMEKYLVSDSGDLRRNGQDFISRETQLSRNQGMKRIVSLVEEPGERFVKNWQLDIVYSDDQASQTCWKMSVGGLNGGDRFTIDNIGTPVKTGCQNDVASNSK